MTASPDNEELFTDLTEALAMSCSLVGVAVIVKDGDCPSHLAGDPKAAKLLSTLECVQATLNDGIPRWETPSPETALAAAFYSQCTRSRHGLYRGVDQFPPQR